MKEDFLISIKGIQTVNGQKDSIDLKTVGSYINRGNKKYITYREFDEKNSAKSTLTVLSIHDNVLTLRKIGDATDSLVLEAGKHHRCFYHTFMGVIQIGVFTYKMHYDFNSDGGNLYAGYSLDFNSEFASKNELFVSVKPKNDNLTGDNKDVKNSTTNKD
ncbi:MAG: DUF1934 domain-containing protein [Clostridia bacterium]|nr:DUF1934 domain-containing protein [Clostridia bacterium]